MDMKDRLIRHKVRRTINHLTVLTCVAASGHALYPMIVTSRKVPDNIYHGGHRPDKDFLIERNAKPYVNRPLVENFIRHQSILHVTALWTNPCHSKAEVVLLMDNCSTYVTPEIFRPLGKNHIKIVTFAPHTTNIFQAFDLPFFGVFKTKAKFWMDQDDDMAFPATTHKLVRQFHSVATPENIHGSFVMARFSYSTGAIPYVLEFSRERMMESAGFRQVWELNIPLEILSMRRQKAEFGLGNETSFQPFNEKKSEFNRAIARKSSISEFVYFTFSHDGIRRRGYTSNV
jgi:hypothetical protein